MTLISRLVSTKEFKWRNLLYVERSSVTFAYTVNTAPYQWQRFCAKWTLWLGLAECQTWAETLFSFKFFVGLTVLFLCLVLVRNRLQQLPDTSAKLVLCKDSRSLNVKYFSLRIYLTRYFRYFVPSRLRSRSRWFHSDGTFFCTDDTPARVRKHGWVQDLIHCFLSHIVGDCSIRLLQRSGDPSSSKKNENINGKWT